MLFSNDGHRIFHESLLESTDEVILHDVHGMTLTETRSSQGKCIKIYWDITTILRNNRCAHVGSDLCQEVSNLSPEEPLVGVLGFVTKDFGNFLDGKVMFHTCHVDH